MTIERGCSPKTGQVCRKGGLVFNANQVPEPPDACRKKLADRVRGGLQYNSHDAIMNPEKRENTREERNKPAPDGSDGQVAAL